MKCMVVIALSALLTQVAALALKPHGGQTVAMAAANATAKNGAMLNGNADADHLIIGKPVHIVFAGCSISKYLYLDL